MKIFFIVAIVILVAITISPHVSAAALYYEYFDTADQSLPFDDWTSGGQTPAATISGGMLNVSFTSSGCPVPEASRLTNNSETLNASVHWMFNYTGDQPRSPKMYYLSGTNRKFAYGASVDTGSVGWQYHITDGDGWQYNKSGISFSVGTLYDFRVTMTPTPTLDDTNVTFEFWVEGNPQGSGDYNETMLNFTELSFEDAVTSMGYFTDACPEPFMAYFDNVEINISSPVTPSIDFSNIIPSTSSVGYEPNASSQLDVNFSISDPDSDSFNVSITWWNNITIPCSICPGGISWLIIPVTNFDYVFTNVTGYNITAAGQGSVTFTLTENDTWWADIRAEDDTSLVSEINTTSVTVQYIPDDAPVLQNVTVVPSMEETGMDGLTTDQLDCKFNATDLEGDPTTVGITWWNYSGGNTYAVTDFDYSFINPALNVSTQTGSGTGSVTIKRQYLSVWWCQATIVDSFGGTMSFNSSNATAIDTISPFAEDESQSATSGTIGDEAYFYVNCTDNETTASVLLQVTTPLGTSANFSMTPDTPPRFNYTLIPASLGAHDIEFFCQDEALNTYTGLSPLSFTSTLAGGGSSSSGGGGGSSRTVIQNVTTDLGAFCGNNVCDEGENPGVCLEDCPLNIDRVFTCVITDPKSCADTGWFTTVLFIFLGGVLVWIMTGKRIKTTRIRE